LNTWWRKKWKFSMLQVISALRENDIIEEQLWRLQEAIYALIRTVESPMVLRAP